MVPDLLAIAAKGGIIMRPAYVSFPRGVVMTGGAPTHEKPSPPAPLPKGEGIFIGAWERDRHQTVNRPGLGRPCVLYLYADMSRDPKRRQVIFEAARLLYARDESEYHRAKFRAAWQVYGGEFSQGDLPTNREVRQQILELARADHRQLSPEELGVQRPLWHPEPGGHSVDRFLVYARLLAPLEKIRENRHAHPEGDLLYHSLQVFELAYQELPYDEEFLLAGCCTTWARPSIRGSTWRRPWSYWTGSSRRGRPG